MSVTVESDKTKSERIIMINGADDLRSPLGRGGCWFRPEIIRVTHYSDGREFIWIGGTMRKKNGALGLLDTGEHYAREPEWHSQILPDWARNVIDNPEETK